jgi:hypothetical protein
MDIGSSGSLFLLMPLTGDGIWQKQGQPRLPLSNVGAVTRITRIT